MKYLISFCVPTFNRSSEITKLIDSILPFIKNNCELVICDDGSTDKTREIINEIINKKKFNIKYKYISHSGRPNALREAVLISSGEYIIISDDDDYFETEKFYSLIKIIKENKKTLNKTEVGGLNFLCRNMNDNTIIGDKFPKSGKDFRLIDLRYVNGIKGDKCEVYKSKILKKNLYALIKNEIRIPTIYLQARINNFKFLCFNLPVKIVQYKNDGMTNNLLKYKLKSPNYTYLTYLELYKLKLNNVKIYEYLSLSINYWRFYLHADYKYRKKINKNLILFFLSISLGSILYMNDKIYLYIANENRDN